MAKYYGAPNILRKENIVRFKKPSELQGSRLLYPKTQKAMSHDPKMYNKDVSSGKYKKYKTLVETNPRKMSEKARDAFARDTLWEYPDVEKSNLSQFHIKTKHIQSDLLKGEKKRLTLKDVKEEPSIMAPLYIIEKTPEIIGSAGLGYGAKKIYDKTIKGGKENDK